MNKELSPLEAFEELLEFVCRKTAYSNIKKYTDIIETALKDYENLQLKHRSMQDAVLDDFKKLKALEIIKEKNVNVGDFKRCKSLEDYNDYCCYGEKEQLTQEEFDFLKEVLL